jgi:hypothetical protein
MTKQLLKYNNENDLKREHIWNQCVKLSAEKKYDNMLS